MNFTTEMIHKIYKVSYSTSEIRGKKRQHIINNAIIDVLKNDARYSDCSFKTESTLTEDICLTKSFNIDVLVYRNGVLIKLILIKASASNIKQNSINLLTSRCGEVIRVANYLKSGVELEFINFLPNTSPYFKKNEEIKHFEINSPHHIGSDKEHFAAHIDFSETTITFDIDGLNSCKTKKEVKTLFDNTQIISNIKIHN
jgi:hypothetical protein